MSLEFNSTHIVIIGDVILDRYWHGTTNRISPEAPVPITHIHKVEDRAGGAANVACNIKALGGYAILIGIVGNDEYGNGLLQILSKVGVMAQLHTADKIGTITKIRTMSNQQQLMRADFEQPLHEHTQYLEKYIHHIKIAKVLVLSDYNKGTLDDPQKYIALAKQHNVKVLVDPKGNDFVRYRGAHLITPNLKEFQQIVGTCHTDEEILEKAKNLVIQLNLQGILVTLSDKGMLLIYRCENTTNCNHVYYPAHSHEVFDVTGAGDTVIATLAAGIASGFTLEYAVHIANVAAGIAVTKSGTASVSLAEINIELNKLQQSQLTHGVVTQDNIVPQLALARANQETIVMTNGCFDILHAGHVKYLEQAAALGNRLVVALNSDASVKRLKGTQRPIYNLQQRIDMLSSLRSVDWIIVFEEDNPANLVELIKPDILVKGGDYRAEDVVGYDIVNSYGGKVEIMEFIDSCSTSSTINKILQG